MTPDIRQKFFASLKECTRVANQAGCMPPLGVVMRPERPSFGWFINGDRCDRCQPWPPNRFAGLRLSRARWVLLYMTAKSWEVVTTRNKCLIVCYRNTQEFLHDWLFRRDLRPHRNHLGSYRRCRFRACTADRPSCSQKSTRLKSLSSHLNSPNQWLRKTFSFFSSVLVLHVSPWIFTKLTVRHSISLFFGSNCQYFELLFSD